MKNKGYFTLEEMSYVRLSRVYHKASAKLSASHFTLRTGISFQDQNKIRIFRQKAFLYGADILLSLYMFLIDVNDLSIFNYDWHMFS